METDKLKKCKCGSSNGMCCKTCSRVKLVVMLRDDYKKTLPETMRYNPVFNSRVSNNKLSLKLIADLTLEKLMVASDFKEALNHANLIIAYDKLSNTEITRFEA